MGIDDKIVIQYWFFYLYNDHIFDHEGDWEMIQIICDENGNPQKAGYSQHYGGEKRSWNSDDVEKVDGTHPKVYVAKGGHASYFESGTSGGDSHPGNGMFLDSSDYSLRQITNENWLNFRGDWGEDGGSVPGPVFRHTKFPTPTAYIWIEPMYWKSSI